MRARIRSGSASIPVASAAAAVAAAVLVLATPAAAVPQEETAEQSPFVRNRVTDGYTTFDTATRVYRRPDGTGPVVTLVGVVHIGDRSYYDALVKILGRSEIVLYESVLPRGAFGTRGRDDAERQRRTQDAMLFLRTLAASYERMNERPPASLAELRAFTVSRDTRLARPFDLACIDGWGHRVGYASAAGAYAFVSLGADGTAGGQDAALDLVLPRVAERATADTAAAPVKKGGKPDERRDLYKEMADALGVSLQVRSIDYDRAGWEPADLPMEELLDRLWKRGERSVTLEMLSKQDGLAQGVLRFFLSMMSDSPQFKKMVIQGLGGGGEAAGRGARGRALGRGSGALGRGSGALGDIDTRIIIDERNDAVVEELAHQLAKPEPPKSVAIFYGAAHMGDFEATLRSRWGLEPAEVTWNSAMGVDEWNAKKINERIETLEAAAQAFKTHDAAGAYPACARIEWRLEQLVKRRK